MIKSFFGLLVEVSRKKETSDGAIEMAIPTGVVTKHVPDHTARVRTGKFNIAMQYVGT